METNNKKKIYGWTTENTSIKFNDQKKLNEIINKGLKHIIDKEARDAINEVFVTGENYFGAEFRRDSKDPSNWVINGALALTEKGKRIRDRAERKEARYKKNCLRKGEKAIEARKRKEDKIAELQKDNTNGENDYKIKKLTVDSKFNITIPTKKFPILDTKFNINASRTPDTINKIIITKYKTAKKAGDNEPDKWKELIDFKKFIKSRSKVLNSGDTKQSTNLEKAEAMNIKGKSIVNFIAHEKNKPNRAKKRNDIKAKQEEEANVKKHESIKLLADMPKHKQGTCVYSKLHQEKIRSKRIIRYKNKFGKKATVKLVSKVVSNSKAA